MPETLRAFFVSSAEGWVLAAFALFALLAALGIAVHVTERVAHSPGRPGTVAPRPTRHQHLSPAELARLSAIRSRARLMEEAPLGAPGWLGQLRHAWRSGYSGWILACLVGAFSMATHFGVWWLAVGGGMLGAVTITLLCTALMVLACAWIGLGLIAGR